MPAGCCVPQCDSGHRGKKISFHKFPRDEILKRQWIVNLRIGAQLTEKMRVCGKHFTPDDYWPESPDPEVITHPRKFLLSTAIPTRNLPTTDNISTDKKAKKLADDKTLRKLKREIRKAQLEREKISEIKILHYMRAGPGEQPTEFIVVDLADPAKPQPKKPRTDPAKTSPEVHAQKSPEASTVKSPEVPETPNTQTRDETTFIKDRIISEFQKSISEQKDHKIRELQRTVAEQKIQISEMQRTITEKDRDIAALKTTIAVNNDLFNKFKKSVSENPGSAVAYVTVGGDAVINLAKDR